MNGSMRTPPLGIKVPNSALELGKEDCSLVITILGASGDLAKRKTYPALCTLHSKKFLPENCKIFGYARSALSNDAHKEMIRPYLKVRTFCLFRTSCPFS